MACGRTRRFDSFRHVFRVPPTNFAESTSRVEKTIYSDVLLVDAPNTKVYSRSRPHAGCQPSRVCKGFDTSSRAELDECGHSMELLISPKGGSVNLRENMLVSGEAGPWD